MIPDYIQRGARKILASGRFQRLLDKYDVTDADVLANVLRTAFYLHERERGVAHAIAVMTACQAAPRSLTDRELFAGMGTLADQYQDQEYLNRIIAGAKAHGYQPNPHDFYMGNLARFEGDPEAFVPATGGRGHIEKVCRQRGIPCSGAVNVKGREPDTNPLESKVKLAEDIVQAKLRKRLLREPGLSNRTRELREDIVAKHGAVT